MWHKGIRLRTDVVGNREFDGSAPVGRRDDGPWHTTASYFTNGARRKIGHMKVGGGASCSVRGMPDRHFSYGLRTKELALGSVADVEGPAVTRLNFEFVVPSTRTLR